MMKIHVIIAGGFIYELSGDNRVVLAASRSNQLACAGFLGELRQRLKIPGLSLAQAYESTAADVINQLETNEALYDENFGYQEPILDDNGDKYGHLFSETGYNTLTPGTDGYISSGIFDLKYEYWPNNNGDDDSQSSGVQSQQVSYDQLLSEPPSISCSNVYEDGCPLFNLALVKSDMTICHNANIGQITDVTDIVIKTWASSTGGILQAQYADEGPPQEVPQAGTIGGDDDESDIQTTITTISSQSSIQPSNPQLQTNDDIETPGPFTTSSISSTQTSQTCGPLNYLLVANPIGCASISGYRGILNIGDVEFPVLTIDPSDFGSGQHTIGITYNVWAESGTYGGSTIAGIATYGGDPELCDLVITFTV